MNSVILIGRLTRDPEISYIPQSNMAVAKFILAVDRPVKQGQEKKADFPRVTVFGRQAENCERFLSKGSRAGIEGRIQTGSYRDKNGQTVYTTDVIASRVEFLEFGHKSDVNEQRQGSQGTGQGNIPEGFIPASDDDISF